MSLKEELMKITTYEEWDTRREEFKSLNFKDREIIDHLDSLWGCREISNFTSRRTK